MGMSSNANSRISPKKETLSTSADIKELWSGQSIDLLKALHILTADGKLNADTRRKLKQVYHLAQLLNPVMDRLHQNTDAFTLVDVGAGKSYLGFILYDLILRNWDTSHLIAIESQPELIAKSKKLAQSQSFNRMQFLEAKISEAKINRPVSMVCALHACDTATDDAIFLGLANQAQAIAIVPCCQAEVARLLDRPETKNQLSAEWGSLFRFPLHRREFGSHLTNVLRVLLLESKGYAVQVTELVGWEHSMKNELIIAEYTGKPNSKSTEQLAALIERLKIQPEVLSKISGFPILR
jgi:hypothetical protein